MKVKTTQRGFQIVEFNDASNVKCTLQQSSATIGGDAGADFIWLGVHDAEVKIMKSDAIKLNIKIDGEVSGWMDYKLPSSVEVFSRMHLDREQVGKLIPLLTEWVETGKFE